MLSKNKMVKWLIIFLLSLMLFAACTDEQKPAVDHYVAPRFREIYRQLYWDGVPILGEPISNLILVPGSEIEKQYFDNGVLIYNPEISPHFYLEALDAYKRILEQHLEDFGLYRYEDDPPDTIHFISYGVQKYASETGTPEIDHSTPTVTPLTVTPTHPQEEIESQKDNFQLNAWEALSEIPSTQSQQFAACVSINGIASQDFTAELKIFLPTGREKDYHFPMPIEGGCSFLAVGPIEAKNGTTIKYQVCVTVSGTEQLCKEDNFLIWGNP